MVGDNGAGKSTLMKIVAGVQPPTSGDIEIAGEHRVFANPIDAVESGISTVYQDLALAMHRDVVAANFFLGREVTSSGWLGGGLGWLDRPAMRARTRDELADSTRGYRTSRRLAVSCRAGSAQALAIAARAAWCRRVLLLDEPTSALGVKQQQEVLELIRRIRDAGVAVVLVSHQMQDVVSVCDRVTVLRLGKVAARLTKDQITVENLVGVHHGGQGG